MDCLSLFQKVQQLHHSYTQSFDTKIFVKNFILRNSIYVFNNFDETTNLVKDFYNQYNFPNYKEDQNKYHILKMGNESYLKNIKKLTFPKKKILDVGAGTCQFSIYFAIGSNSHVFALDPAINSLNLGREFCENNNISNVHFINGSIFDNIFKREIFDFVMCSGSLHHTKDPYLAFQKSISYLKKNGYVLVGLYNSYARKHITNFFLKYLGNQFINMYDKVLKKKKFKQQESWIKDQYYNVLESTHSISEVLEWFKKNNIEPICGIPSFNNYTFDNFENKNKNSDNYNFGKIHLILKQIKFRFTHFSDDSGLFVMLGKKN